MTTTYYKLVEISYKDQSAKFKIRSASRSAEIHETIRSRFDIPSEQRFALIDKRDGVDVVVDGTLETGSYTLEVLDSKDQGGCCPPGSLPASAPPADYKVKGKFEKWNGVSVYVTGNKESKTGKAVIILTDIYGVNGGRTKQVADEFALSGYLTVVPDFFGDDAWNSQRDFSGVMEWIKKYSWNIVSPTANTVLTYLEALGFSKIGVAGFCWGTFGVLALSATGKISAGVSFHPSHPKICAGQGLDEAALVEAAQCPQLLLPASNDSETTKEKGLADQILSKKKFKSQIREFPEMTHGFAVRGDLNDPKVARDVRIAMDLATSFFNKHI